MPKFTLMAHQREGVKFLHDMDGVAALLWDPGVGKTGTTLTWVDQMADRTGEFRVLVVAPLTAADTWVLQVGGFMDSPVKSRMLTGSTVSIMTKIRAARDWATVPSGAVEVNHTGTKARQVSGNRVTIVSMSAGALSSFCTERSKTVQMLAAIRKYAPHLIVVDESHIIKSATANISKAMYQIGQLAPHRIILTGTVNPLNVLDCYGQWRFLAPWTFSDQHGESYTNTPHLMSKAEKMAVKPWPWGRFKDRYTTPGGYMGHGIGGFRNEAELRDRVAERSMVVSKEDALDLPPVTDMDVHVTLSTREQNAYDEMRDDLAAQMADGSLLEAPNALSKIMKLRQIAAGFVKNTETGEVHQIGDSLRKTIKEVVNVRLAGEQRIVVFGYFRSECEALRDTLAAQGRTVEMVTGSTPAKDRLAIRRRFGDTTGNPQQMVLVAQARTMSLSVNELVTAQHAVYGSYSERRDDWVQSRGRLDRQGQTKPVTFWNCYVPGSIGEVMLNNNKERGSLEKALLDHIRAVVR